MADRPVRKALPWHPLLLALMAGVIFYLVLGFVRQAGVNRQRREELRQIEQETAAAQAEFARLQGTWLYVQSPQAAEEWARQNSWARPDEVSVVVVAPPANGSAAGEDQAAQDPGPASPREAWWDLFFGPR